MKNILFLIFILISWGSANADFGVAIGGLSVPHYMGSAQNYQLMATLPFYLKENEIFKENKAFVFEFDAELNLPISGEDLSASEPDGYNKEGKVLANFKDYARRGMGFLPASFYMGLKVGLELGPIAIEASSMPGVQLGHGWGNAGVLSKVGVKIYTFVNNSGKSASCLCFYSDALFTNSRYNNLYYSVTAPNVLADRPEFDGSKSGFLGIKSGFYFLNRWDALVLMGMFEFQDMSNSVVRESPLVRRKSGGLAALGVAYLW